MSADAPPATESGVRCFLALLPDAASRSALQHCRDQFDGSGSQGAHGVRWLDSSALHTTLRFFGSADPAQCAHLQHALPALACGLPRTAARRYAIWPNRARPRLLVVELVAPVALSTLAHACETLARSAGFAAELHPFRAHLTLARLRPGCVLALPQLEPLSLRFDTLALMQSHLGTSGATYQPLATTPIPTLGVPA
ncbi:MAG TPA: RNA 2',3'-cyclic phosphodiesterase [Rhodanobacteraceae bacterium]